VRAETGNLDFSKPGLRVAVPIRADIDMSFSTEAEALAFEEEYERDFES
jgi:hypothetical protein